jgi:hypothetical protein
MRNNKTLLKILVDNFDKHFMNGICSTIWELYYAKLISIKEARELERFIEKNKPNVKVTPSPYWWQINSKLPRKRFLNKLLKQVENA